MQVGSMELPVSTSPWLVSSNDTILSSDTSVVLFCDFLGSAASEIRVYLASSGNSVSTPLQLMQFSSPSAMEVSLPTGATGVLRAVVTRLGLKSNVAVVGMFQSQTIHLNAAAFSIARSNLGNRIELHGYGFGHDASEISVNLSLAVQVRGIYSCEDTLLVFDLGDTSTVGTGTLSATVQRVTDHSTLISNEATVANLHDSLEYAPVLSSSIKEVSQASTEVSIQGSNFGTEANDVRVYLTSAWEGAVPVEVHLTNSSSMKVIIGNAATPNPSRSIATVSVKGVLSNTATVALKGQEIYVESSTRLIESPIEGYHAITINGNNLLGTEPTCAWSGLPSTPGTVVGDGSAIHCSTPMAVANTVTELSLILSHSDVKDTGVTVHYFATMLVSNLNAHSVVRFNARTGQFWDLFVKPNAGGLNGPWGTAFGVENRFLVASANTGAVLMYNGSTGVFTRKFCSVPAPHGLVMHHRDLYVCSSHDATIYRFNGTTGSPKGVLAHSPFLQHAWAIVFDYWSNRSLVTSQVHHHIVQIDAPRDSKHQGFHASRTRVWSNKAVHHITGIDVTYNHVYAVSPYGEGIMQFNRSTGVFTNWFEAFASQPYDVKIYNKTVFVCGAEGVHQYTQWHPLYLLEYQGLFASHTGTSCVFLLIHDTIGDTQGRK